MVLTLPTVVLAAISLQVPAPGSALVSREPVPLLPGGRWRIDNFVSEPSETDRAVISIAPTLWWNDVSDLTAGVRLRSNYDGRDRWTVWVHRGLSDVSSSIDGTEVATLGSSVDFRIQLENPRRWAAPGRGQRFEAWSQEGTAGARIVVTRERSSGSTIRRSELDLAWVATPETGFLDDRLWDNAGTVEVGMLREWQRGAGAASRLFQIAGRIGFAYRPNRGLFSRNSYTGDPFVRLTGTAWWKRRLLGFDVGLRGFGGVYLASELPVKQRAITVQGADPYQTLVNPLIRTRAAPLSGADLTYHAPGNLNMRGYRPGLGGRWGVSLNLDVERRVIARDRGVFRRLSVLGFWDGALVDTVAVVSFSGLVAKPLYDGGVGVRTWFHVGDLSFPLRIEFPFYVSSPFAAQDRRKGTDFVEFRWLVSVQPIF